MKRFAATIITCCIPLASGWARERPDEARYVFHEVKDGILRLDTRRGDVSHCSRNSIGWVCRVVPDERSALDAEFKRLQQENAMLREELAAARQSGSGGASPPTRPAPQSNPAPRSGSTTTGQDAGALLRLPTAEDVERARAAVATIWRRLVDMMASLRANTRENSEIGRL